MKVVTLVRDPFELIISGYLYHYAAKEKWCSEPMRGAMRKPRGPREFGLKLVLDSYDAKDGLITADPGNAPYDKYLKSISLEDGLLAEFVRATMRDLPALELALQATRANEDESSYECLDSFTALKVEGAVDPYTETWRRVFEFLEYPRASIPAMLTQAQKHDIVKSPTALHGHGTSKNPHKRHELFSTAFRVDQEKFNGKYARFAKQLGCPQPSNPSHKRDVRSTNTSNTNGPGSDSTARLVPYECDCSQDRTPECCHYVWGQGE